MSLFCEYLLISDNLAMETVGHVDDEETESDAEVGGIHSARNNAF